MERVKRDQNPPKKKGRTVKHSTRFVSFTKFHIVLFNVVNTPQLGPVYFVVLLSFTFGE